MFGLMLFMICFFVGMIAMLLYMTRKIDSCCHALSDEHAQLRVLIRTLESRLDVRQPAGNRQTGEAEPSMEPDNVSAGYDPLLRLSFEKSEPCPLQGEQALTLEPSISGDAGQHGRFS